MAILGSIIAAPFIFLVIALVLLKSAVTVKKEIYSEDKKEHEAKRVERKNYFIIKEHNYLLELDCFLYSEYKKLKKWDTDLSKPIHKDQSHYIHLLFQDGTEKYVWVQNCMSENYFRETSMECQIRPEEFVGEWFSENNDYIMAKECECESSGTPSYKIPSTLLPNNIDLIRSIITELGNRGSYSYIDLDENNNISIVLMNA